MIRLARSVLLTGILALAACSPKAEAPGHSAGDTIVASNPLFGKWQLTHAQVAPWWDGKGEAPLADPAFTSVTFAPDKSSGPPLVTCDKPKYSVSIVKAPGLFEGNLADPFPQARMLGFMKQDITMMSFGCASGTADISLDFPMLDDDTILLGLDNVIYTLTRTRS
jgi:hypothetical protein